MTTAVLLALRSGPDGCTALLPSGEQTVLARLADLLGGLGVTDLTIICRARDVDACQRAAPQATVISADALSDALEATRVAIEQTPGRVLVIDGDVVAHRSAIAGLIADPRIRTGVLVGDRPGARPIATQRGYVVAAASPFHTAPRSSSGALGLLVIDDAHRAAAAKAAADLAAIARARQDAGADPDVTALLTVGVVRADVPVRCAYLRELFWARPTDVTQATDVADALARADESRALMNSSVKATDGFFGTFFCSPYTKYIARACANMGIRPNQVSVFSLLLGLSAAAAFANGSMLAGSILLYFTLAFDCVDGQLARYTRGFTALGAWLDPMFDRIKEYSVYAGLAIAATDAGSTPTKAWGLACAAIAVLTARHFADFSFGALRTQAATAVVHPPLEQPDPDAATAGGPGADEWSEGHETSQQGSALVRASRRANRVPGVVWIKRIIQFPIGERYATIAVAAVVGGPVAVFVITLAWGALALTYASAGRLLRSVA